MTEQEIKLKIAKLEEELKRLNTTFKVGDKIRTRNRGPGDLLDFLIVGYGSEVGLVVLDPHDYSFRPGHVWGPGFFIRVENPHSITLDELNRLNATGAKLEKLP